MSADRLRLAASRLRQLADTATLGTWKWGWQDDKTGHDESYTVEAVRGEYVERIAVTEREKRGYENAAFIAAMSPALARAVADLLEAEAPIEDDAALLAADGYLKPDGPWGRAGKQAHSVADAVLGEAEQ